MHRYAIAFYVYFDSSSKEKELLRKALMFQGVAGACFSVISKTELVLNCFNINHCFVSRVA